MDATIKYIKELVAEGQFANALRFAHAHFESLGAGNLQNEVVLLRQEFTKLESDNRKGIIAPEDNRLRLSQLTDRFLKVLDTTPMAITGASAPAQLPERFSGFVSLQLQQAKQNMQVKRILQYACAGICILGLWALFAGTDSLLGVTAEGMAQMHAILGGAIVVFLAVAIAIQFSLNKDQDQLSLSETITGLIADYPKLDQQTRENLDRLLLNSLSVILKPR